MKKLILPAICIGLLLGALGATSNPNSGIQLMNDYDHIKL